MRIEDFLRSPVVAAYITETQSVKDPFLGLQFFPNDKVVGLSVDWIRQVMGVNVMLKVSTLDSTPTLRTREGFKMESSKMAFFREQMHVNEHDMLMLATIENDNNPYIRQALTNAFNDVEKLVDAADVAAEVMRMQLLATNDGTPQISLGAADNTIYTYNYDPDGDWKTGHYIDITTASDQWDAPETATPLDDLNKAKKIVRKNGFTPAYALMNSNTFAYLLACDQIKSAMVNVLGNAVGYVNDNNVSDVIRLNTGLIPVIYDKTYKDYTGAEKYFYPDNRVTVLPAEKIGSTWFGTTPEERTLLGNPNADITILDRGVAIAVKTDYGPPAQITTTVSQMAVPSYEGMDGVAVLNVASGD